MITEYQQSKRSFLGEFPSCAVKSIPKEKQFVSGEAHDTNTKTGSVELSAEVKTEAVLSLLRGLEKWFDEVHQLCRTSATEILVFMANDLDRKFHLGINNAHPVAYALKGSSMTNEVFKLMIEHVIKMCEDRGLIVIATSSDGQWHKYGVRGQKDAPLTVYQLQKDMWKEQKSKPKSVLLKEVRNRYKVSGLEDIRIEKQETGSLVVLGHARDSPLRVYSSTAHKLQSKLDTFGQDEGRCTSDIVGTGPGNDLLTLFESLENEHDVAEEVREDVQAISSMIANAYGQNAAIDMQLGDFMTLMFTETYTDNANYSNIDMPDEHIAVNNDCSESMVDTVNNMSLAVSVHDINNSRPQGNCFTENDTEAGTVMSLAFATLSEDTYIEDIYLTEGNSLTHNEMDTCISVPENEVTDNCNGDDNLQGVFNVNPSQNESVGGECTQLLKVLRDVDSKRKAFWEATSAEDLLTILNDNVKIFKTLQKKEIMICFDTLNKLKNASVTHFVSLNKTKLTDALSNVFHNVDGNSIADDDQKK
ncbi:hypothetical protein DPMN_177679 [Dreissena polymorpha]|uniref:Uncharacterized protein n=1 Tax=Dreissena polymorpha TaxID=45954 RepID=A0A9D4E971_DREPO|nr:hypothetical protein DPMN_177679 [Dreissena polymorpha]